MKLCLFLTLLSCFALQLEGISQINVRDNLATITEVDEFEFEVRVAGKHRVELRHDSIITPNTSYWHAELLPKNSTTVLRSLTLDGDTLSEVFFEGLNPGFYILRVRRGSSYSEEFYTAVVTRETSGDYEVSPNEERETATPLTLGSEMEGNLASTTDIDYFTFSLPTAGRLDVDFRYLPLIGNGSTYWILDLFQQSSTDLLQRLVLKGDKLGETAWSGLPAGNYVLKVEHGTSYSGKQYFIDLRFSSSAFVELEPNDIRQQATALFLNGTYRGNTWGQTDIDIFEFENPVAQTVTLEFSHDRFVDTPSRYWYLKIQPADASSVLLSVDLPGNVLSKTRTVNLPPGRFVVEIERFNTLSMNTYSLLLSAPQGLPKLAREVEIQPAFELSWESGVGTQYEVQTSNNGGVSWHRVGALIDGDGSRQRAWVEHPAEASQLYRILELSIP